MATFTVTTNADGEAGSELTLREAITAANATEGTDVIEFDGGAFSGGDANTIRLNGGLGTLLVTDSIVIDATRVAGVTITGDAAGNDITTEDGITDIEATARADLLDNVRPMAIFGDNEETLLRGLTLTGGYVQTPGTEGNASPRVPGNFTSSAYSGGGLFIDEGSVTFEDGAVSGNAVFVQEGASIGSSGGGIFFLESVNPFAPEPVFDILRVIRSSIEGNHVIGDFSGAGGGIHASFLQLQDSTVANNSTESSFGFGGGLAVRYDGSLRNATIYGNATKGDGTHGGGVWAPNNLEILNSTIVANRVEGDRALGGGIASFGGSSDNVIGGDEKRIANSIILGNTSAHDPSSDDIMLSIYGPTAEFRDENTFDGVNIVGALNDPQPDLTTYNGPVLQRAMTAIFENGGELADNGGTVKTVKLLDATSNPAIDGSGEDATAGDATGRPAQDFPGRGSDDGLPGVRDIGAYELPLLTGGVPNVVPGGEGDDRLIGRTGDDQVLGDLGNDTLIGRGGDDTLTGGAGNDAFVFLANDADGVATITDFEEGDLLAIDDRFFANFGDDGIDVRAPTAGQLNFAINRGFFGYDEATGEVSIQGDVVAQIEPGTSISADDIVVF